MLGLVLGLGLRLGCCLNKLGGLGACSPNEIGHSEIASEAIFGPKMLLEFPHLSGPKIRGVTLHICAVIKLEWAVIKAKLGSVKIKND